MKKRKKPQPRKQPPQRTKASRKWLVPVIAVPLLAAAAFLWFGSGDDGTAIRTGPASRPHVLLLGIDTLREDHTCNSILTGIRTPHMDALAEDGIRFTRCHSTAPWTLPSFASIFTGQLPSRHEAIGGDYQVLDESHVTIAERFDSAGYNTYGWYCVEYLNDNYGMTQGYNAVMGQPEEVAVFQQSTTVTALSLAFFRKYGRGPCYLFSHYFAPHAPYEPPPPYDNIYYFDRDPRGPGEPILDVIMASHTLLDDNKTSGMYDWLEGITDWKYPTNQYAAEVSFTDEQIGNLVAGLKEMGLYDDMLIVLVADHGEHLMDHDIYFTHYLPYQETIHVPLIVKLPGNRGAGRIVEEPVSTLDVLPTIMEIAVLGEAAGLPGHSLLGAMLGQEEIEPRTLLAEQGSSPDRFTKALVEWPWKLMYFREGDRERVELYDLQQDPFERADLAAQRVDVAQALTARLWTHFDPASPLTVGDERRPADLSEAERQRLRSLGYVD